MRIQYFEIAGVPYVYVTADTRAMCQRLAFEIASHFDPDSKFVVAPFREHNPDLWTQGFDLRGIKDTDALTATEIIANAVAAGVRLAAATLRANALTPVEGVPISVLEEMSK